MVNFDEKKEREKRWLERKSDPARIRTWNPLIRSQMPYPLGHRAGRDSSGAYSTFYTRYIIVFRTAPGSDVAVWLETGSRYRILYGRRITSKKNNRAVSNV